MAVFDLPCVIFAGGKSSRMGHNKALLPFGGYPTLAQFQYERLSGLFSEVYIVCKDPALFGFTAHIIAEPYETYAPTAGFVAMFEALSAPKVFVLSVDTPFVTQAHIQALIEANAPQYDAIIAQTLQGTHPMCGIYSKKLLSQFETMLQEENHKLGMLLQEVDTKWVAFEDEEAFFNLNHPHEYEAALKKVIKL